MPNLYSCIAINNSRQYTAVIGGLLENLNFSKDAFSISVQESHDINTAPPTLSFIYGPGATFGDVSTFFSVVW